MFFSIDAWKSSEVLASFPSNLLNLEEYILMMNTSDK